MIIPLEQVGRRLDRYIRSLFPGVPQSHIERLIRSKTITLNGQRTQTSARLQEGDVLSVPDLISNEKPRPSIPNIEFTQHIIFEDQNFIVLNKPRHWAVQGGSRVSWSLDELLISARGPETRLVHRLDKDTSGVIIIAKNLPMSQTLTTWFKRKKIEKTYLAIVVGSMPKSNGFIDEPIEERDALTYYKVLDEKDGFSFLELKPQTGRKHQLRLHCASLGCPILGDPKYLWRQSLAKDYTLHLHAASLTLPDGSLFEAPLPEDFLLTLKKLDIACF